MRLLCCSARSRAQEHDTTIDPSDFRRSKTVRTMCPCRVNIRFNSDGLYRITVVQLTHNHLALFNDKLPDYKPPTAAQKEFVRNYAKLSSITCRDIQALLLSYFPDHPLNPTQVSNMIHEAKCIARDEVEDQGGDLLSLMAYLAEKKDQDDRRVVRVQTHADSNEFRSLFIMTPRMVKLASSHSDVIINDITLMRNKYGAPLDVFTGIDSQYKTFNLGYAVLTSETTQDHQWAIGQFFSNLPPCPSRVFFSDGDIAVRSAVSEHDVWHGQCLKHINENLKKNLAPVLGPLMQPFLNAFWLVYYAVSPTAFDIKWQKLLEDYPASREYLEYNLGPMKTQWAWCYVATRFTCGVRTTGRVESENAVNKLLGGVKTSLYELVVNLLKRDEEQAEQEQLAIQKVGTDSSQATFLLT